ncbi:MAG TPA: DUF507 family protein [Candidatus Binatia bacterium]|jgi:hypothetical protein
MKIRSDQLDKLAAAILASYRAKDLIDTSANDRELTARIAGIIQQNFAEEEAIETEAREMLASHGQEARHMDPYKMFLLAKQKLAAKKGFIL